MEPFTPDQFKLAFQLWMSGCWILFTILMSMELLARVVGWWTSRRSAQPRPLFPADWPANFALFWHSGILMGVVGIAVIYGGMQLAHQITPFRIPFTAATVLLYYLAADFCNYVEHRFAHEVRFFWADHSIHHSAESYNFTLTYRLPPLHWLNEAMPYAAFALMGFDPTWMLLMKSVGIFQFFIHTDRIGRLGLFDHIFCSPANHQVHHARNPIYVDKNYGSSLLIWDKLFGTFQLPTDERVRFGITHRVTTGNPFKIWVAEFRLLFIDFAHAPGFTEKLKVLLGRPGETFEYHAADSTARPLPPSRLAAAE